jgi:spore maturation protein CgeB
MKIMINSQLDIVILGLSITSSWGNGHATTYRSLMKHLTEAGHKVTFLERDTEWYASNRDMPVLPYGNTHLYNSMEELKDQFGPLIKNADFVIVGSYVPEGVEIGEWVTSIAKGTAFYDIDTPVTLMKLKNNNFEYITPLLISKYNMYLSFTGGPILKYIENEYGSPSVQPLYCSVDTSLYYPEEEENKYDLGYLGTYSDDRQPVLENLLLRAAVRAPDKRFIVAGPMYPDHIIWPDNVERIIHLSPKEHRKFYNSQKFTLNITRSEMIKAGYSPSVRLFEAAACGVPIISDFWKGIETFFEPQKEILISYSPADTIIYLNKLQDEERIKIGLRAKDTILKNHTAAHRAEQLVNYINEVVSKNRRRKVYAG